MITPVEIAVDLGRDVPAVNSAAYIRWGQWIEDARMLLSGGDGIHEGLGDLDALDQTVLDYVVRQAVVAHSWRPDQATQVRTSVDDAETSRTYEAAGRGEISIKPEWWAMLTSETGDDSQSGAFTVRPSFEPDYCR